MLTSSARAGHLRHLGGFDGFGDLKADSDGVLRLRKGDEGPEVADWQANLLRLGFAVNLTGTFDSPTIDATVQVQSKHGQKETGVVDDDTRSAVADDLDKLDLPHSTPVSAPVLQMDPVQVSGGFPSWMWLAGAVAAALVWKKRRK